METPLLKLEMPDAKTTPEIWVNDFAKIKNCSRQTVYNAVQRGELHSINKFATTFIINDTLAQEWKVKDSMKR